MIMGISGHMLGPKKLRALSARSGLLLARATRRGFDCEGVVRDGDTCHHYAIDYRTGRHQLIPDPWSWSSCPAGCDGAARKP